MKIAWHGHACFEVQGSEGTVLMDPHDGKSLGIRQPNCRPDLVLISHGHFDHNCTRVLKGHFVSISEAGSHEVKGIKIKGVEAAHDELGGAKRGPVIMFCFEMGGISFLHCGDLGHALTPEMLKAVGRVDILFVPVGGVFTLDGKQARKVVDNLAPKVAVPMHYRYGGLSLSIQPIDPFLAGLPDNKVQRVGNSIDFMKEELPQETEYWVFSP
jgi:L-ascorbate metabolism protein UlaG (beta-lactamase superfamily)